MTLGGEVRTVDTLAEDGGVMTGSGDAWVHDGAHLVRAVLTALAAAVLAVAVVYVVGIRLRSSVVRDAARRFHHAAGTPFGSGGQVWRGRPSPC
jgi:hypothetical protein